jgi:hypothetical protein
MVGSVLLEKAVPAHRDDAEQLAAQLLGKADIDAAPKRAELHAALGHAELEEAERTVVAECQPKLELWRTQPSYVSRVERFGFCKPKRSGECEPTSSFETKHYVHRAPGVRACYWDAAQSFLHLADHFGRAGLSDEAARARQRARELLEIRKSVRLPANEDRVR